MSINMTRNKRRETIAQIEQLKTKTTMTKHDLFDYQLRFR
jgi:hypothetical protein